MRYVRTVLVLLMLALGATAVQAMGPWYEPVGLQEAAPSCPTVDPLLS